ncbi:helix-turn-helix domain-containing protein [Clostridium perfringens]
MNFKTRLKELREANGLTQKQLADKLNEISNTNKLYPQNISYWENGREPSLSTIVDLAILFDVSVDYLLGNTDKLDYNEVSYDEKFNTILNKKVLDNLLKNLPDYSKSEFYKMFNEHIDILNLSEYIDANHYLSINDLNYIRLITDLDKILIDFKKDILSTLVSINNIRKINEPLLKELNYNRINELNLSTSHAISKFSILLCEFNKFLLKEIENNNFLK